MPSFFKTFFAALLALVVFSLLVLFLIIAVVGGLTANNEPKVPSNSVLVLDLSQHYAEQEVQSPLGFLTGEDKDVPGLYDVVILLHHAQRDKHIAGIYIVANNNPNGFAASDEIRNALLEFRTSGKFVIAHGDVISQKAYGLANAAEKIYVSP